MKARTISYIIKEGFINILRNKIMSVASVGTVVATLLLFGMFYLVIENVNYIALQFQKQPEVTVYTYSGLDDKAIAGIEDKLKSNPMIKEYTAITQKQAFEKLKTMLAEDDATLAGLDASFLPTMTYTLKLNDPNDCPTVVADMKKIAQVESVDYISEVIKFKATLQKWIGAASAVIIGLLVMVSIFIISNDIKLAVFARRREIKIMKYVGSTDAFIKLPFAVEGMIIGLIGALISFFIIGYVYSLIATKLNEQLASIGTNLSAFISFIEFPPVSLKLIATYVIIGLTVGISGSLIAIRRHLVV